MLLDPAAISVALQRIASEIVARKRTGDERPLVLIAIRRGGEALAHRLAALMVVESGAPPPPLGVVDITLYRDDAATALPNPRIGPSHIPSGVDGRRVVLVDDVLHTGRTIRAALDAVLDYGRPSVVELAVLVDRGGRELPIQADYVGQAVDVPNDARVEVMVKRTGPRPEDEEPWALLIGADRPVPAEDPR